MRFETTNIFSSIQGEAPLLPEKFFEFGQGPKIELPFSCVHHAFEAQAIARPSAIAVRDHLGNELSYEELDKKANLLAAYLQANGVKTGDAVGLYLKRSIPMIIGILAILKSGAAYVPQHLSVAPDSQLLFVNQEAKLNMILTIEELEHLIPGQLQYKTKSIETILKKSPSTHHYHPNFEIDQHQRAFILFTSGTTGKPNGVQVTHKNVCNILHTRPGNLGIKPGMKVSQILSIAFDMAAWEILGCLSHGGTLLIRGRSIIETAKNADVLIATPSILASLDYHQCQKVKVVALAGEPCPKPLAELWSQTALFYNNCGPTETTIVNTMHLYQKGSEVLNIGKPTPNNTVYILDEEMNPCELGEIGEMWAGGHCVTAGYIDRPELNQDRYRPDPYLGGDHMMFRTRDLGRWTADGELEHFGRTDDQVKIKGFRVELDSVSNMLELTPHCKRAVTLKLNSRHLISFVEPADVDLELARRILQQNLPYYCEPTRIYSLDQLPRTERGKIDKRKLTKMAVESCEREGVVLS